MKSLNIILLVIVESVECRENVGNGLQQVNVVINVSF